MNAQFLGKNVQELRHESGSILRFSPERGGIICSLVVGGNETLYMDEADFQDENRNIHGGIPFLFPICGRLKDGKTRFLGREFALPPHGFARNLPFTLTSVDEKAACASLRLRANDATRALYPFDFEIELTYQLTSSGVEIRQRYANLGADAMPLQFGFHPYFSQSDLAPAIIESNAVQAFDFMQGGRETSIPDVFTPNAVPEFNLALSGVKERVAFARKSPDFSVQIEVSEHFRHCVFWALADKPFLCMEPWTALPDAMNSGADVLSVAPGESLSACLRISALMAAAS